MNYKVLKCDHCGTKNAVGICSKCGRYFVITESHARGHPRTVESAPLSKFPSMSIEQCDFCSEKATGSSLVRIVNAGIIQQSCASCHQGILYIWKKNSKTNIGSSPPD